MVKGGGEEGGINQNSKQAFIWKYLRVVYDTWHILSAQGNFEVTSGYIETINVI